MLSGGRIVVPNQRNPKMTDLQFSQANADIKCRRLYHYIEQLHAKTVCTVEAELDEINLALDTCTEAVRVLASES